VDDAVDLLGFLRAREARDALERAAGWIVLAYHEDMPRETWIAHGPFQEAAAALAYAHARDAEMRVDGAEGFRFDVLPIMPTGEER
jgi:hypothetical protein